MNGDGAADIIIGISTASNSLGQSTGAAYVVFGHLSGVPFTANLDLSALTGANGFKMTGEAAGALFGSAVSTAGDVNGDGRADVLIGARDAVRSGSMTGAAYLVFGRNTAFQPSIAASTLNGATGVKIYGLADGNHIGAGVASAGDINADGFSDILIGSSETSLAKAGSSYVIFGKALAFASTFNLATLDGNNGFAIIGETSADRAGESVGSVGDFNGDTFGDIIVGAPGVGAGTSYLVFGRPTGFAPTLQLGSINGTTGFRYQGVGTGDESGSSVNGAGDVNGDGKMDLIIGARSAGPGISTSGEAYVVYGSGASLAIPVASPTGATVKYTDIAGNQITITATVGKLTADMLVFDAAGNLSLVDLNASGTFKNGSSLSFTAVRNDTDQPLNVGTISAPGITLLAVTVTGNLNKIDVGGANPLKTAIRSLTVGSLGTVGGAIPAPGEEASITSDISGRIGKLTVTGDINYATINVSGAVGLLNVGGNFLGTGAFTAAQVLGLAALGHGEVANVGGGITLASSGLTAARIGTINLAGSLSKASVKSASTITSVKVGVDVHKSAVVAAGAIRNVTISGSLTSDDPAEPSVMTALASVANGRPASAVGMGSFTVKGNVLNALVLIGYDSNFVAKNSDAKVGSINVTGTWTASSFAVGIDDITDNGFGRNDRPIFGGTDTTPEIISSIARITIGGIAQGNGDPLAHFGITAQYIGNAKIAGLKIPLVKTAIDEYPLGTNFSLVEVSAS